MPLKVTYPYDKNGQPLRLVGNTNIIFDGSGTPLDLILSKISKEAAKKKFLFSSNGFPDVGDPDCLYCDATDFYVWDETGLNYKKIISETASSALEKAHSHANKIILDAVTKAYTIEEGQKLSTASDLAATAIQNIKVGAAEMVKSGSEVVLPVYPDRNSLAIDQVDNTSDLDKPISHSTANEFTAVRNELAENNNRAEVAEDILKTALQDEEARAKESENTIKNSLEAEVLRAQSVEQTNEENLSNEIARATSAEEEIRADISTNKPVWDDKYTKNEVDNKFSALETAIDWKEAVDTYGDLSTFYPNPDDGWTVNVKDTDYTYRWSGTSWIAISANSIPKATSSVDGLLSKEDKASYDDANSKKHTHLNKTTLDKLTETFLENWNAAFEHISNKSNPHDVTKTQIGLGNVPNVATNDQTPTFTEASSLGSITSGEKLSASFGKIMKAISEFITHKADAVIHITSAERTKWNAVTNKVDKVAGKGLSANDYSTADKDKLAGIASRAEVNVQPDWNTSDTSSDSYIKNKPSAFPPVLHNHTKSQITDFPTSMPASDVSDWAKKSTKPSYSWSEIGSKPSTFPPDSHTHNYAGALSAGGAANAAVKVNNALNINGQAFDGSAAVGIDLLPFVVGTQTAITGAWTGNARSISALIDGMSIRYWLPFNGSGNATLNLTLKDGTETGAIACYYRGTSRLTTHFPAGSLIILTYCKDVSIAGSSTKYTGWWPSADYNSDTQNRLRMQNAVKAKSAIATTKIITGDASGYAQLAANTAFDIRYPILFTQSSISAGATGDNNYLAFNSIPLTSAYTFTATAYSLVFIKGTLNGNTFSPDTTILTCTLPTTADGFTYMLLGYAYSTSAFYLLPYHPLYQYIDGQFQEIVNTSLYSSAAAKFKTARKIGNASFDGTKDITLAQIGAAAASHTHPKSQITDMPTKLSQFTNDKGFITQEEVDTSQNHTHSNKAVLDKLTQGNLDKLNGIAAGAEVNVQSDWNVTDSTSDAYIKNKPSTFPPSAHTHTKAQISDFPTSMPASDVPSWAKVAAKPSYSWNEIVSKPSTFTPSGHTHQDLAYTVYSSNTSSDKANKFYKLATMKITQRYGYISRTYECIIGGHGQTNSDYLRLNLWFKQQEEFGKDPYVYLSVMANDSTIERVQFYTVVDELNSAYTQVSLYVKTLSIHTNCFLFTVSKADGNGTIIYYNNTGEFIDSMPTTGTLVSQVDCSNHHKHTKSQITDFPASLPANGGNAATVNGHTVESNVPSGAKFTDTIYSHPNSGVAAGTYTTVTVNAQGHVTAGSKSAGELILKNIVIETSSFTDLSAIYSNASILANHVPDVVFDTASQPAAAKAGISAKTEDGKLILTALKSPESNLTIKALILKDVG